MGFELHDPTKNTFHFEKLNLKIRNREHAWELELVESETLSLLQTSLLGHGDVHLSTHEHQKW